MENERKINDIIKLLNKQDTDNPFWDVVPTGYYALTEVEILSSGNKRATFMPNRGIPVKVFVNTKTGEVKTFLYEAIVR